MKIYYPKKVDISDKINKTKIDLKQGGIKMFWGLIGTAAMCFGAVYGLYSYMERSWKWVRHAHDTLAQVISIILCVFAVAIAICPIVLLIFLRPNTEIAYYVYRYSSLTCFCGSIFVALMNFVTTRLTNDHEILIPGRFAGIFTWVSSVVFFIVMWGWWDSSAWFF